MHKASLACKIGTSPAHSCKTLAVITILSSLDTTFQEGFRPPRECGGVWMTSEGRWKDLLCCF